MNRSKKKDVRFWRKWRFSGATPWATTVAILNESLDKKIRGAFVKKPHSA
jgi:hypothetical protein